MNQYLNQKMGQKNSPEEPLPAEELEINKEKSP
jgi:hypothetical protein